MVSGVDLLVIDANIAVKWVTDEPDHDIAISLYNDTIRSGRAIVTPYHFDGEVANAIWRKAFRGLISLDAAFLALDAFGSFETVALAPDGLLRTGFEISRSLGAAAVYDALYVALAEIVGCELWTADSRLLNAASALPVEIRLLSTYSGL